MAIPIRLYFIVCVYGRPPALLPLAATQLKWKRKKRRRRRLDRIAWPNSFDNYSICSPHLWELVGINVHFIACHCLLEATITKEVICYVFFLLSVIDNNYYSYIYAWTAVLYRHHWAPCLPHHDAYVLDSCRCMTTIIHIYRYNNEWLYGMDAVL